MSYAQDNGYTPMTFEEIMDLIRVAINDEFETSYTTESFIGTGWYKYLYGPVQEMVKSETLTSEIFHKLQEYIRITNERIQRPSVSAPGLIDSFESFGFIASVKENALEDAGTISICVDLDESDEDFDEKKLQVCELIQEFTAAGLVSIGDQSEEIVLSNGQAFNFRFDLPNRQRIRFRVNILVSKNNRRMVLSDQEIREQFLENYRSRWRLGWNIEPQRYLAQCDLEWASEVEVEYFIGDTEPEENDWESEIYESDYRDLFELELSDIEVLIE